MLVLMQFYSLPVRGGARREGSSRAVSTATPDQMRRWARLPSGEPDSVPSLEASWSGLEDKQG